MELRCVDHDRGKIVAREKIEGEARSEDFLTNWKRFIDSGVEVHAFSGGRLLLGVVLELLYDSGHLHAFTNYVAVNRDRTAGRRVRVIVFFRVNKLERFLDQLGIAKNGGQRIIKIVRDPYC